MSLQKFFPKKNIIFGLILVHLSSLAFVLSEFTFIEDEEHIAKYVQRIGDSENFEKITDLFSRRTSSAAQTLMLVGDSHASHYLPTLEQISTFTHPLSVIPNFEPGCAPFSKVHDSKCRNSYIEKSSKLNNGDLDVIIFSFCWYCNFKMLVESSSGKSDYSTLNHLLKEFITSVTRNRHLLSKNGKIIIILDNPIGKKFDPRRYLVGYNRKFISVDAPLHVYLGDEQFLFHKSFREIMLTFDHDIIIVDPIEELCSVADNTTGMRCKILDEGGLPIFRDQDHFSATYAKHNIKWLNEFF